MAAARQISTSEVLVQFLLHGLEDTQTVHIEAISEAIAPNASDLTDTQTFRNLEIYDGYFRSGYRFEQMQAYFVELVVDVGSAQDLERKFHEAIYRSVMGNTSDISWEIILRILSLVRSLVHRAYETHYSDRIYELLEWTNSLILSHRIDLWLENHGGWEAVPDWSAQIDPRAMRASPAPQRPYQAASTPPEQTASRFYESEREVQLRAAASPIPRRRPRLASQGRSPEQAPQAERQSPSRPAQGNVSPIGMPIPDAPGRVQRGRPLAARPDRDRRPPASAGYALEDTPPSSGENEPQMPARITPERSPQLGEPVPPRLRAGPPPPMGYVRRLEFRNPARPGEGGYESPPSMDRSDQSQGSREGAAEMEADDPALLADDPFADMQFALEDLGEGSPRRPMQGPRSPPPVSSSPQPGPSGIGQYYPSPSKGASASGGASAQRYYSPPTGTSPPRGFSPPRGASPPRGFTPPRGASPARSYAPSTGASPPSGSPLMQEFGSPPRSPHYPQSPGSRTSPQRSPRYQ